MKSYTFKVMFEGGINVIVQAFTEEQAIILAQAKRIKDGGDWKTYIGYVKLKD